MNILFSESVGTLQDPADLQANQRGELTPAQEARLKFGGGWQSGCSVIFFAIFFVPFFIGIGSMLANFFSWQVATLVILTLVGSLMLAGSSALLKLWRRWGSLKRDQENRAIRQGQGQLRYEHGEYVAQANDKTLILPKSHNACGLKPGATYHFYFLEESGMVLSAEEISPPSPSQIRNSLLEILASANQFTLEDLDLNRNGELSTAQRMKALPNLILGFIFGGIPLVFGFFTLNGLLTQGVSGTALLMPMLILLIFALIGGFMAFNALSDLLAASPMVTEGVGHKEKRTSRGKNKSTRYYYVVEGVSFQVQKSAFAALVDGEKYRVYALPRTKRIVTIEPL